MNFFDYIFTPVDIVRHVKPRHMIVLLFVVIVMLTSNFVLGLNGVVTFGLMIMTLFIGMGYDARVIYFFTLACLVLLALSNLQIKNSILTDSDLQKSLGILVMFGLISGTFVMLYRYRQAATKSITKQSDEDIIPESLLEELGMLKSKKQPLAQAKQQNKRTKTYNHPIIPAKLRGVAIVSKPKLTQKLTQKPEPKQVQKPILEQNSKLKSTNTIAPRPERVSLKSNLIDGVFVSEVKNQAKKQNTFNNYRPMHL